MADFIEYRTNGFPKELLGDLQEILTLGKINQGFQLLTHQKQLIDSFDGTWRNAGLFLGLFAQWVDVGFGNVQLLKKLLTRFPETSLADLPVRDFLHLQIAIGILAYAEQQDEIALSHFELVLAIEKRSKDLDLLSVAAFWICRCYRRQAKYRDALSYLMKAKDAANILGQTNRVAAIQVLEGWILYQEGRTSEGAKALNEAETVLLQTDDYVARANLYSVYGWINRHCGDYERAIQQFEAAIDEYRKLNGTHRNIATGLLNLACVKRLLAVDLGELIDNAAAVTRKSAHRQTSGPLNIQDARKRVRGLRDEAFQNLSDASAICTHHRDCGGLGHADINYGYLQLDEGALDIASTRAESAYLNGEDRKDVVLKARARILQSEIEQAKIEEQLIESATPAPFSRLASEYAQEAVELAKQTQNRSLLSLAYSTLGLALFGDGDFEMARDCRNQAAVLLKAGSRDYMWRQLQILKNKLTDAGTIAPVLRDWSRGITGEKTFQQITEDFAAFVIPRVWQQEGHKISRVAARLSISPKKVRRILRNHGVSARTELNADDSYLSPDEELLN